MKLEEAAAPLGTPRSAGTCSPSKTTITTLDQLFIVEALSWPLSCRKGPGSVLDSGTVVGSGLPEGCGPALGLSQEPLPWLRAWAGLRLRSCILLAQRGQLQSRSAAAPPWAHLCGPAWQSRLPAARSTRASRCTRPRRKSL